MANRDGFKMIECDVRKTVDGKIVIIHDVLINRTCGSVLMILNGVSVLLSIYVINIKKVPRTSLD